MESWNGAVLSAARLAAGVARTVFSTDFASIDPELMGRSFGASAASSRCCCSSETLFNGVKEPAEIRAAQTVGNFSGYWLTNKQS